MTLGVSTWVHLLAMTMGPTPAAPVDPQPPARTCPDRPELTATQRAAEIDAAVARAVDAFAASNFAEALAALDTADCLEPRPAHTYIRGAILKEQGECAAAIEHFDAFLAADVPRADAEAAAKLREECRARQPVLVGPPTPPSERAPEPGSDSVTPGPALPQDQRPRLPCPPDERPDALGIGLTTVSAAVLAAGIGMLAGAQALKAAAPNRSDLAAHDRALRTAQSLNPAGWVTAGIGAAGLTVGVIRLGRVRVARRAARRRLPKHCR